MGRGGRCCCRNKCDRLTSLLVSAVVVATVDDNSSCVPKKGIYK